MDIRNHIREIPDFPKPGILFYDISTLLRHAGAWKATVEQLAEAIAPYKPDLLVGIEARGFLLSAPLSYVLGCGSTMVRKARKLPGDTLAHTYSLEYGEDTIEVQTDAATTGQRVVIVDDLLATGGTLAATIALMRSLNAEVCAAACIIELTFLNGRDRLDIPFQSLVAYDE